MGECQRVNLIRQYSHLVPVRVGDGGKLHGCFLSKRILPLDIHKNPTKPTIDCVSLLHIHLQKSTFKFECSMLATKGMIAHNTISTSLPKVATKQGGVAHSLSHDKS